MYNDLKWLVFTFLKTKIRSMVQHNKKKKTLKTAMGAFFLQQLQHEKFI